MKYCLYYFVTVTVVAAVTEVVVGALAVVVGVVCVVTMVAVDGGVDGDIVVAVVDNDEASLGAERNSYSSYVPCYSCTNLFYSAQYCVSNFQEASDFTRSLRLCFVAFNLWKNCTCEKRFEKICICHKISLKYEVSFLRGLQQFR